VARGNALLTHVAEHNETSMGAPEIADVVFCAHLDLRQRSKRLEAIESSTNPLVLLSESDGAIRHLHQALQAVDDVMSRVAGAVPTFEKGAGLERSLRVRSCYAVLVARIGSLPEPTTATLAITLRRVGTNIAMLAGLAVFDELRVRDRHQIRGLRDRLLSWLRGCDSGHSHTLSGFELWSDIKAFVLMLREVSRRQELVAHDTSVLTDAAAASFGPDLIFPRSLQSRLARLVGLDPEIDRVLASDRPFEIRAWLPFLAARGLGSGVAS
jgi:hypothetical protein